MTEPSNDLMKLVLDSGALSIWNNETGPVFWGVGCVPMPFYINTEVMIGKQLAEGLLEQITTICASTNEAIPRAKKLHSLIVAAYDKEPLWQQIVAALVAKAGAAFPSGSYQLVSGGERRDWLFSIPFAREIGRNHLYLFKDGSSYCEQRLPPQGKALHVCDLINNAASHFDMWLPMLDKLNLSCSGTLAVNSRGDIGMSRLKAAGYKAVVLNAIDLAFFQQLHESGLLGRERLDEIDVFFNSATQWAEIYLMGHEAVFKLAPGDSKSPARMKAFFAQDPWQLRSRHEAFFEALETKAS